MTTKMKSLTKIVFGLTLILTSCNSSNKAEQATAQQPAQTTKAKLQIFNEINKTIAALSQNGIGQLSSWRDDLAGGYMSITEYYQFGNTPTNGLTNNIAYYLESDNANYIKTLKLALNINTKAEKKAALKKMKETTEATFQSLSLETPKELLEAITKGKDFKVENESYTTTLKLDKSKIDTWQLTIETK